MKQITTKWLCLFLSFYASISVAQANVQDSLALVTLYNTTDGENWKISWDIETPFNTWFGVETNAEGRVIRLNLENNGLNGQIPPVIADLEQLRGLYMHTNSLTGNIPEEIGNLPNLQQVWLFSNLLTGEIPNSIGNLSNLMQFAVSNNQLTGELPDEIGNLTQLTLFRAKENQLTGGIPPSFGNLTSLEDLELHDNQLSGCFDFNLKNLCYQLAAYNIDAGNNFNAAWEDFCLIDAGMCISSPTRIDSLALIAVHHSAGGENWTTPWNTQAPYRTWFGVETNAQGRVTRLNLGNNGLTGHISPMITSLEKLWRLDLHTNQLTGNIPEEIGDLINIEQVWLFFNALTGEIPTSVGNLSNLTHFAISNNQLTGEIPDEIGNLNELMLFRAKDNYLEGNIPASFGNLAELEDVELQNNQLSGCFDFNLKNLCYQLAAYDIDEGNNFEASWDDFCSSNAGMCVTTPAQMDSLALIAIYHSTGGENWTTTWNTAMPYQTWFGIETNAEGRVTRISLGNNGLTGHIPPVIGQLEALQRLDMYSNSLTGNIPEQIGNLSNLQQVWLFYNALSGEIPASIGNLSKLTHLGISNNMLTGELPDELSSLNRLKYLRAKDNLLTGNIPASFGNLTELWDLQLQGNQLSGCFDFNLKNLCYQLAAYNIDEGNNFNASWEDFCSTNAGICTITPIQMDSLTLLAVNRITNGEHWTNSWNTATPFNTWFGVETNAEGRVIQLNLGNNGLKGQIPGVLENLEALQRLEMHTNQLTGNIPEEIGNLPNLEQLWLFFNLLSGEIPASIGNLSNLTHLAVSNNQLTGELPDELSNLSNLTNFKAKQNQLTGNIPASFGNLVSLRDLRLHDNQLTGTIPASFGNLQNLKQLWLYSNLLTGSIPAELGDLPEITHIGVANNQLTGVIPTEIADLDSLVYFGIRKNQLSGTVPVFTNVENVEAISIEFNEFSYEDIAANYSSNNLTNNFDYSPQYYGIEQFQTNEIGTEVMLFPKPSLPNTFSAPSVRWKKEANYITPDYTLHDTTYTFSSLGIEDIGIYTYHFVDNTLPPPLVYFESRPINNYIEGLDLDGQPVIKGELMIEYGQNRDWAYIDSVRTELMSEKYNGEIIDTCGCAIKLDLWRFGKDTLDIVREIIGTDDRERRTAYDNGLDGGQNRKNIFAPDYTIGEQIKVSPYSTVPESDSTHILIGVIDTGINTDHVDIQPNLWVNEMEEDGIPNVDDDGNGCIDDIYGYDFVNAAAMSDEFGHGTKVGGLITANTPENMNIQIMPVKTFNAEGQGTLFDMLCGIYYAVENNSDIINISAGYRGEQSDILKKALQHGRDKNISFVVSAGNDTLDLDRINYWPAAFSRDSSLYNNVFTVTAIDTSVTKMEYASYGDSTVTIAAPGQGIYVPSNVGSENYEYLSGTSAGTPLVSLALAIEKLQNIDRDYNVLRQDFLNTMQISPALTDYVQNGYFLDVDIDKISKIKVLLEGAMRADTNIMRTNMNDRGILPGQIPLSPLVAPTPSGQPYNNLPWDYDGTEWENQEEYTVNIVDWVLVSLRTNREASSEIYKTAAQLRNDGVILLYRPILNLNPTLDSVYIVVEHRNHMAVMSPQKVPIVEGRVVYDFTTQDSYKDETSYGQTEIRPGIWTMIAGDGNQVADYPYSDITGSDKQTWFENNGSFDIYSIGDYDLNGDVNGSDKAIWGEKNGISNRVPK